MSPGKRKTRSNSTLSLTLSDIKDLIEASRTDILRKLEEENDKLNERIQQIFTRMCNLEETQIRMQAETEQLKAEVCKLKTDQVQKFSLRSACISKDLDELRSNCNYMMMQFNHFDSRKRRKSFIIRNFPENACTIKGKVVSTCKDAVDSIAECLDINEELVRVKEACRIGRRRDDGKPRLIMVKACENTVSQFLRKSSQLKQCEAPLNRVFLQEDLPPHVTKKLSEMRQRAYQFRAENPGEEAYVKGKRLYIKGVVVDEIGQNF